MFPSWGINYHTTGNWKPSIDFVFCSDSGAFILVELKTIIKYPRDFKSAFCQVTHRASLFANTYSRERLLHAHTRCVAGAGERRNEAFRLLSLATAPATISLGAVHRVIGAVSFPRCADTLLPHLNQAPFSDLLAELPHSESKSSEFSRFREIAPSDYLALAASPAYVFSV